ncbi:MAG: hypothetical protein ACFWTQ_00985 [Lactococcus sp.]|jgi:LPXTG-motif cell wall-anchored protein
MIKKITLLIVSILLCSSIGLLSVVADTESTFTLKQSVPVESRSPDPPSSSSRQPNDNVTGGGGGVLPTTGKNVSSLPVTGEQLTYEISIMGAFLLVLLFVFWKNKKGKEENNENYKQ